METFSALLPFLGETTGHQWVPLTKASNAEFWFFVCAWTNGWENSGDAGELGRHGAYYDVTAIGFVYFINPYSFGLSYKHKNTATKTKKATAYIWQNTLCTVCSMKYADVLWLCNKLLLVPCVLLTHILLILYVNTAKHRGPCHTFARYCIQHISWNKRTVLFCCDWYFLADSITLNFFNSFSSGRFQSNFR